MSESLQEQLQEYRRRKATEARAQPAAQDTREARGRADSKEEDISDTERTVPRQTYTGGVSSLRAASSPPAPPVNRYLKFGMWFVLLLLMHEVGMTWPYAVLTGFYLIYELTEHNSHRRKAGEKSAYSVFNRNCEAIDGTLDASQFETELRHGSGALQRPQ